MNSHLLAKRLLSYPDMPLLVDGVGEDLRINFSTPEKGQIGDTDCILILVSRGKEDWEVDALKAVEKKYITFEVCDIHGVAVGEIVSDSMEDARAQMLMNFTNVAFVRPRKDQGVELRVSVEGAGGESKPVQTTARETDEEKMKLLKQYLEQNDKSVLRENTGFTPAPEGSYYHKTNRCAHGMRIVDRCISCERDVEDRLALKQIRGIMDEQSQAFLNKPI